MDLHRLTTALAALFGVACLMIVMAIGIFWLGVYRLRAAGEALSDPEIFSLGVLSIVGAVLAIVYAGAGWTIWRRKKWSLAMLLSAAAILGFPIGTALSIIALILLTRPAVRQSFTD